MNVKFIVLLGCAGVPGYFKQRDYESGGTRTSNVPWPAAYCDHVGGEPEGPRRASTHSYPNSRLRQRQGTVRSLLHQQGLVIFFHPADMERFSSCWKVTSSTNLTRKQEILIPNVDIAGIMSRFCLDCFHYVISHSPDYYEVAIC